jgi:hypothetical protein
MWVPKDGQAPLIIAGNTPNYAHSSELRRDKKETQCSGLRHLRTLAVLRDVSVARSRESAALLKISSIALHRAYCFWRSNQTMRLVISTSVSPLVLPSLSLWLTSRRIASKSVFNSRSIRWVDSPNSSNEPWGRFLEHGEIWRVCPSSGIALNALPPWAWQRMKLHNK